MAKILLVEDDPQMIHLYEKNLVKEGFEVVVARDGVEGLVKMQEENPDLVLLDIIMPHMGGEEMLRRLRENRQYKDVPVLILTSLSFLDDSNIETEAQEYILKADTSLEEIVNKIKKHLPKGSQ